MSDNPIKRVLVELDCLLDTRIATVAKISQEAAIKLLEGTYHSRDMDDFHKLTDGLVSNDEYKDLYSKRDREILKSSRLTNIISLVKNIVDEVEKAKLLEPHIETISVDVNVCPYQLNDDEKELIVDMIVFYLGVHVNVDTVFYPLESLTPSFIKNKYDAIIIYEFDTWFSMHLHELNQVLIPRNMVFAPALFIKQVDDVKDVLIEGAENYTPFNLIEMSLVDRLSLELIHSKEFSILHIEGGT